MERFTVVIPTLDRCVTLAYTLETCVAQQDDNFEILVSNNRSSDVTRDVIEDFQRRDERVRYIEPGRRMGMATHFDFALDHVGDGFMMLLGSDDALLPGCMPRARAYLEEFPDAKVLHQGFAGMYVYPEVDRPEVGALTAYLDPVQQVWDARSVLDQVAQGLALPWDLPYPYNLAWMRTSVMDEIVSRTGRRIHATTPDLWLGVAAATIVDNYPHMCPPFALLAISAKSTGLAVTTPDGEENASADFLESELELHPKIAYGRSVHFLVIDCLLRAIDAGLLPPDYPIAVDKAVARVYYEIVSSSWGDDEMAENLKLVKQQAEIFGCIDVIERAEHFATWQEWRASLDFPLDLSRPWALRIDTRKLGITDVRGAAQLAEELWLGAAEDADRADVLTGAIERVRLNAVRNPDAEAKWSEDAIDYEWGQPVEFASVEAPFAWDHWPVFGFGSLEVDRAWTVGPRVSIALRVPRPRRDVLLEVEAQAFLHPPGLAEQTVRVLINGQPVGQWHLTPNEPGTTPIRIPRRLLSDGSRCVIEWEIANPSSPLSLRMSLDPRELGLSVTSIRLAEIPRLTTFWSRRAVR